MGISATIDSLNPFVSISDYSAVVYQYVYPQLVEYDTNNLSIQPSFATKWETSPDGLVWTFHTVPRPGEFGYETWPKDAWKYVGGANNWGEISIDAARGIAREVRLYERDAAGRRIFRGLPPWAPDGTRGVPVLLPAAGRLLRNPYFSGQGPLYHMLVVKGYTRDGKIITDDPGTRLAAQQQVERVRRADDAGQFVVAEGRPGIGQAVLGLAVAADLDHVDAVLHLPPYLARDLVVARERMHEDHALLGASHRFRCDDVL